MKRFVEGEDRAQGVLLPEFLDDHVAEDNPVRAIAVFVDELDLRGRGFEGVVAETTGRPAYHPATMLKIYVYGYVNQPLERNERGVVIGLFPHDPSRTALAVYIGAAARQG